MLNVYERRFGKVVVFCLAGPVVVSELSSLRDATEGLTDLTTLLLDMRHATIIDAAGLGRLLELRADLNARGIEFRLMNIGERISHLLRITRLDTIFETSSPAIVIHLSPLSQPVPLSELAPCA